MPLEEGRSVQLSLPVGRQSSLKPPTNPKRVPSTYRVSIAGITILVWVRIPHLGT